MQVVMQNDSETKVGNKGSTFIVRPDGNSRQLGKLIVKKAGLEWRTGKAQSGKTVRWDEIISYFEENKK